jgi:enoyl-CoA hydratase/carnithine racemase
MKPHTLDSYKNKYENITLERDEDGILLVRIHDRGAPDEPIRYYANDRPYNWKNCHFEWSHCFYDIARDYENEIVILTGTGDRFIGVAQDGQSAGANLVGKFPPMHPEVWDHIFHNGRQIHMNLLNIECPVIGVVNGAALTHAELLLLSDIVLCSENAIFQDQAHFESGLLAAGDSVALVWPELIGQTRASYFLLTGQKLDAMQALEYGIVNEVLPRDKLLPRAYELARLLLKRPKLVRRYTRALLKQKQKEQMLEHLTAGLALEGLTAAGRRVTVGEDEAAPHRWAALGPNDQRD